MTGLAYLGRGWTFPVEPEPLALTYTEGPDKVKQAIGLILDCEPGERIMRPTWGCGLRRYLMQPNTVATRSAIQKDVERALGAFEPRIQVSEVAVDPGDDPSLVYIRIAYVHVRDGRPDNLVFPFYLQ